MAEAESDIQLPPQPQASIFQRVYHSIGLHTFLSSPKDIKILFFQRFVRLFAYGQSTLILTLYFGRLGIDDAHKGLFMSLTLFGDMLISFCLTLVADSLGRRKILALGAVMMAGAGATFALASNFWILLAAAIIGVISPSGNEIGPFRAIEESTLAQLTPAEVRSDIFGWYALTGAFAAALGNLSCGWIVHVLHTVYEWDLLRAYRMIYLLYTGFALLKLLLTAILSAECEAKVVKPRAEALPAHEQTPLLDGQQPPTAAPRRSFFPHISPESRSILLQLSLIMGLDSAASGVANSSWITYYFAKTFSVDQSTLGIIFFTTNLVTALSSLAAVSISKRIGLVKTMVFTHLPSAIFLALVPVFPGLAPALTFLILRSSLAQMDVAPRSAFIAAVVLPSERTAVMGWVNVVKTCAQGIGPTITGWLASTNHFGVFFILAGCMKATYDLLILVVFSRVRTDREGRRL
ncbi:hypothetical protein BOTBODRAFT_163752 [Botryobasidium botryosum FD-172 SS1]|uniref:Major facilitator superfamily (MFS) profile domain-containing protein n=1 Tax=Botryobasidium botryosum (strain FD-172 SS1) TaxID=930990 RepID=A0A067MF22_BOTB1|nr:hypothetical protein BOTBODRAFT_163752 [Botryobasidium botryosum FD-172 SS1]